MSNFKKNTNLDERREVLIPTNPAKAPFRTFKKLKVLILSANSQRGHIRVARHVTAIEEALNRSKLRRRFDDIIHWPVSEYSHIRRKIEDNNPHIVHFIGHGTSSEVGLKVEDDSGIERVISNEKLVSLFKNNRRIRCVILNACYSEALAEAIYKHVDCVIGISDQIGEIESAEFAEAFYDELGAGNRFDKAFEEGRGVIARPENLKLFYRHSSPLGRAHNRLRSHLGSLIPSSEEEE